MFQRCDARCCGVVGTGRGPDVRSDFETAPGRLRDHEPNVIRRVDVPLIVHNDLDYARPKMRILPDGLDHFVARIGHDVLWRHQFAPIGLQLKLASIRSDDPPGGDHRWSSQSPVSDRLLDRCTGKVSLVANVAHRCEAGVEHRPCVDDAFDRSSSGRFAGSHRKDTGTISVRT
jgi:hypothetical protein